MYVLFEQSEGLGKIRTMGRICTKLTKTFSHQPNSFQICFGFPTSTIPLECQYNHGSSSRPMVPKRRAGAGKRPLMPRRNHKKWFADWQHNEALQYKPGGRVWSFTHDIKGMAECKTINAPYIGPFKLIKQTSTKENLLNLLLNPKGVPVRSSAPSGSSLRGILLCMHLFYLMPPQRIWTVVLRK